MVFVTVDLEIPIDTLPPAEDLGGEDENWVVSFAFLGQISRAAIDEMLKLDRPAAHIVDYREPNEERLVFRSRGMMDVVVADATETIRPFIGRLINNRLVRVIVISHIDAEIALSKREGFKGFDVTKTVKGHLGID